MTCRIPCEGYYRPKDMNEGVRLLTELGDTAKPIAGGTDVLPKRPGGKWTTKGKNLLDLSQLDLDYLEKREDALAVGAMTPINSILSSPFFAEGARHIMAETAALHSTQTIRNRATLGGNLCIGWSTADFALPLLALNAVLLAVGPTGERKIPIDQFFMGANLTDLQADELLKEIVIPACTPNMGAAYIKLRRHQTAVDIAIVNVGVCLEIDDGVCRDVKIAMGGVGPVPLRATTAEMMLKGRHFNRESIEAAAAAALKQAAPVDDHRATAAYRKKMIHVLVRKAVLKSSERIKG